MLNALLMAAALANPACTGEMCADTTWCGWAKFCGAWRLGENIGSDGPEAQACRSIPTSSVKKLDGAGNEAFCVSLDTRRSGFSCFGGNSWVHSIAEHLVPTFEMRDAADGGRLPLNRTNCEDLQLDGAGGGTVYMAGLCCAGWRVPCFDKPGCVEEFVPYGPGILKSSISIMLLICAAVHITSAAICILFAGRLMDSYDSTEEMGPTDKDAAKNVVAMLGAAHGGFSAILVFGALQDWLSGKVQIALVSLVWYAVLGPLAEAMQHGTKPWSQSHYINEFIGVASGECLSKPPKINYIVLCICMTIAIGMETIDRVFIVALCMVAVGIALSILTSIMPAAPSEGESMRAGQSRDEGGRSAEMR
ncbi:hypothetical protein KFE25_001013 [Diacronema lutheri]|uniref:Uncharacterized protein n=1 Tax=Diacronema lutheri TaxID=2081491 RepID=A0A8J5XAE5_DIALT|nr:hypothetical protein KFE25_001013 [Diacronema lutheri]